MHLKNLARVWRVIGGALLLPWYLKHAPAVCWSWLALAQKAGPAHFSPVLYSVTSCWQLKIGWMGVSMPQKSAKATNQIRWDLFPTGELEEINPVGPFEP